MIKILFKMMMVNLLAPFIFTMNHETQEETPLGKSCIFKRKNTLLGNPCIFKPENKLLRKSHILKSENTNTDYIEKDNAVNNKVKEQMLLGESWILTSKNTSIDYIEKDNAMINNQAGNILNKNMSLYEVLKILSYINALYPYSFKKFNNNLFKKLKDADYIQNSEVFCDLNNKENTQHCYNICFNKKGDSSYMRVYKVGEFRINEDSCIYIDDKEVITSNIHDKNYSGKHNNEVQYFYFKNIIYTLINWNKDKKIPLHKTNYFDSLKSEIIHAINTSNIDSLNNDIIYVLKKYQCDGFKKDIIDVINKSNFNNLQNNIINTLDQYNFDSLKNDMVDVFNETYTSSNYKDILHSTACFKFHLTTDFFIGFIDKKYLKETLLNKVEIDENDNIFIEEDLQHCFFKEHEYSNTYKDDMNKVIKEMFSKENIHNNCIKICYSCAVSDKMNNIKKILRKIGKSIISRKGTFTQMFYLYSSNNITETKYINRKMSLLDYEIIEGKCMQEKCYFYEAVYASEVK